MKATELVYMAAGMPKNTHSFPVARGHCSLCRQPFHGDAALKVEDVIKPTFTNRDFLDPRSQHVCVACAYALTDAKFRRRDFWATPKEIRFLNRNELADNLLNPPNPPFVFCVGLSHKKHLVIRTRINLSREVYYCQFEEQGLWLQPKKQKELFASVQALVDIFPKRVVAEATYFPVGELKAETLLQLENIVKPYRGSGVFNLFLHASRRRS